MIPDIDEVTQARVLEDHAAALREHARVVLPLRAWVMRAAARMAEDAAERARGLPPLDLSGGSVSSSELLRRRNRRRP